MFILLMASSFYLIVFRRFFASFTGIIGRVVGFGGAGRLDSTADDFTRVANIYVEASLEVAFQNGLRLTVDFSRES